MEALIQSVLANQSTVHKWKNDFKSEEYTLASELNQKLFGIPLNQRVGCQCVNDLYVYLSNKHKIKSIMEKENRQFLIKKDALIMLHREAKQFSQHSSEEDCIYLLSKYPAQIVNFERYPSNWEEIVNGGSIVVVNDTNNGPADTEESSDTENPRKAELEAMKVNELKGYIEYTLKLEIPEGKKDDLVQFILDNEAQA